MIDSGLWSFIWGMISGAGLLLIIAAAVTDQDRQVVIGHYTTPREQVDDFADPYTCKHLYETGVSLEMGKPRRHRGFACKKCGAILWENGEITIERGRVK